MTMVIDGILIIAVQPDEKCDLCGTIAECRPYGPHGENVCYECGMKNEEACKRAMARRMGSDIH